MNAKEKRIARLPWWILSMFVWVGLLYLGAWGMYAISVDGLESYNQPWFVKTTQALMGIILAVLGISATLGGLIWTFEGQDDEAQSEEKP